MVGVFLRGPYQGDEEDPRAGIVLPGPAVSVRSDRISLRLSGRDALKVSECHDPYMVIAGLITLVKP